MDKIKKKMASPSLSVFHTGGVCVLSETFPFPKSKLVIKSSNLTELSKSLSGAIESIALVSIHLLNHF